MKGWTPEGAEVELTGKQISEVRALLIDGDSDWWTVLHTAVRYEGLRRGVPLDDPAYSAVAAIPARLAGRTQASGACNRGSNPLAGSHDGTGGSK